MTPPAGRRGPEPAPPSAAWSTRLRLRLPEPYDLGWMLGFLADRAAPALERVEPGLLVRVIRLAGVPAVLTVRHAVGPAPARWLAVEAAAAAPAAGLATAAAAGPAAAHLRRLLRRMFDLDTALGPFLGGWLIGAASG